MVDDIDSIPHTLLAYRPGFEESIDHRRRVRIVNDALLRLSSRKRETIELFYFFELSITDIAQRFCSSPSAVKMTLFRSKQELRQMVRTHFALSHK